MMVAVLPKNVLYYMYTSIELQRLGRNVNDPLRIVVCMCSGRETQPHKHQHTGRQHTLLVLFETTHPHPTGPMRHDIGSYCVRMTDTIGIHPNPILALTVHTYLPFHCLRFGFVGPVAAPKLCNRVSRGTVLVLKFIDTCSKTTNYGVPKRAQTRICW